MTNPGEPKPDPIGDMARELFADAPKAADRERPHEERAERSEFDSITDVYRAYFGDLANGVDPRRLGVVALRADGERER